MNRLGAAGRVARAFVDSKLTPLLIAASLALGAFGLLLTPREEEPQIRVPMVDVTASWPGASPEEVESRVVAPLERAFFGISRVEHVYSTSRAGGALITVRFRVNESNEESLVKVFERLNAVAPALPPDVPTPVVELHSIDDVPFLALTLSSDRLSGGELRPIAAELAHEISEIEDTSKAFLIGGEPRVVRVLPDVDRLNAAGVTLLGLASALQSAGLEDDAGSIVRDNAELRVRVSSRFRDARAVEAAVVGSRHGREIAVRDVARVVDGPDEATAAVFSVTGPPGARVERTAVTIAIAKRPGANATDLAERVLEKVDSVRKTLVPGDVSVDVTRNYGATAAEKSAELVEHLLIATLSVVALISLAMGWRSGLVVGIAVPVTLALTLFIYFLAGYTMNRVTLFALIFSIGILVDDAIVVVENIERHYREKPGRSLLSVAVDAVDEVGNPTLLATFTVIAAILPLAFVRGLMGPYMRPIPTGASAAMLFSLAVAFVVSPWAAVRIFRSHAHESPGDGGAGPPAAPEGAATRAYRRIMRSLLSSGRSRAGFLGAVAFVLLASMALVGFGLVKVKMLPFDNKSEFQVLVDHAEGTPLEVTLETARRMARALAERGDVRDVQIYAGAAAPFNFNGLVRHYFLRRAPWSADLQVNLVDKRTRSAQSHDIAKEVRPALAAVARSRGASVKVIEIPPGPPVLDTIVAEVYGPDAASRESLAGEIRRIFETTDSVVDIDDSIEAERNLVDVVVDRRKAGIEGADPAAVAATLASAGAGRTVALLDGPSAREPVPVRVRLDTPDRSDLDRGLALRVDSSRGPLALAALTTTRRVREPQPIHHKDLKPVTYVFADLAGERESPAYALADMNARLDRLRLPDGGTVPRYAIAQPETTDRPSMKWDGEWQITYEVFRDMGIAFAVVMVLIALLVVGWFQSFAVPFAILLPIPLSLIGILPGHWMFGAFFTATSMIGFIAGAGIIVRNSIILVDFIELKLREGMALEDAVVEAGAVRFRPMLLTAAAVVVGSFVILFDPIFQGLAISLMMGEVAATLLSRLAVPVVYFLIARRGRAEALRKESL
jgi:multidrug efflux pump subunit AcrB